MNHLTLSSRTAHDTEDVGKKLATFLKAGDVVGLIGQLGSGKTTLMRGIARGLHIRARITSPSFVVLKIYKRRIPLFHFDLYRLRSLRELERVGYEDFIYGGGISVIEWANRATTLLPKDHLAIRIRITRMYQRTIKLEAHGERYHALLRRAKMKLHAYAS